MKTKEHSLQQQLTILASHSGFTVREIHDIYNENKETKTKTSLDSNFILLALSEMIWELETTK